MLISKLLNVYTKTKNDTRHPIFHILHVDVGVRGVAVAIYLNMLLFFCNKFNHGLSIFRNFVWQWNNNCNVASIYIFYT